MIDWTVILTGVGTVFSIVAFVYGIFRNFKTDMKSHMEKLEKRIDTLEDRMFYMATGKKLEDAIKEERIKKIETQ